MHSSNWTKYGWVLVLFALGALWLRVENQPLGSVARAAPSDVDLKDAPLPPTTIAVIDIAAILKGSKEFDVGMAKIKEDIADFETLVKNETKELADLAERAKQHPPESAEHQRIQGQIDAKKASLETFIGARKNELLKDEAAMYYDIYQKMQNAVKIVCRQKKIGIVLRMNADDMKRDDRNSVLQGINRAVVAYPVGNDITTAVLTELNRT